MALSQQLPGMGYSDMNAGASQALAMNQ